MCCFPYYFKLTNNDNYSSYDFAQGNKIDMIHPASALTFFADKTKTLTQKDKEKRNFLSKQMTPQEKCHVESKR